MKKGEVCVARHMAVLVRVGHAILTKQDKELEPSEIREFMGMARDERSKEDPGIAKAIRAAFSAGYAAGFSDGGGLAPDNEYKQVDFSPVGSRRSYAKYRDER